MGILNTRHCPCLVSIHTVEFGVHTSMEARKVVGSLQKGQNKFSFSFFFFFPPLLESWGVE